MRAPRYRLRFTTGVALTAATYGSGTYGSGTYGEQASDPVASLHYRVVPWPGGYPTDPAWIYRQADTAPDFRVQIRSDAGPLDFTGLDFSYLVLTNPRTNDVWPFDLTVATIGEGEWLTRTWHPSDLAAPATYRAAIVMQYTSGRRFTVPHDDNLRFEVTPNELAVAGTPAYRWDEARWGYAIWS